MFGYDLPSIRKGFTPRLLKTNEGALAASMAETRLAGIFNKRKCAEALEPGNPLPPVSNTEFRAQKTTDGRRLSTTFLYEWNPLGPAERSLMVFQDSSCLISRNVEVDGEEHHLFLPISFFLPHYHKSLTKEEANLIKEDVANWDLCRTRFPIVRGLQPANGQPETIPAWADHHATAPEKVIMLSAFMQDIGEAIAPFFSIPPGGRKGSNFRLTLNSAGVLRDGTITPPTLSSDFITPESLDVLNEVSKIFTRPDFPMQLHEFVSQTYRFGFQTKQGLSGESLVTLSRTRPETASAHDLMQAHAQIKKWTSPHGTLPKSATLPDRPCGDAKPVRITISRASS